MKRYLRYFLVITIILFYSVNGFSQKIGVGVSAIYNIQTESYAPGLRVEIPYKRLSIVPQVAYYPSFNKITEYYAGVSLHLNLFYVKSWAFYGLIHGSYNGWINNTSSTMDDAKYSNWDGELGVGLTTRKCFRPFIEYRYNFKWKETNLRIGVMYFFGCNSRNNKGGGKRKHRAMTCPAYD